MSLKKKTFKLNGMSIFSRLLKELFTGSDTWCVIHYTSSLLMQLHFPSNKVCRSQAHSVCLSCAWPCRQHVSVHKYLRLLCEYLKVCFLIHRHSKHCVILWIIQGDNNKKVTDQNFSPYLLDFIL